VEVEYYSVSLELEHLLYVQTVHHPPHVHVVLPLLRLALKLPRLHQTQLPPHVLTNVQRKHLVVKWRVRVANHVSSLLVDVLELVSYAVMDALVEYSEHVVFFPYVGLDVSEIFLCLEQLPEL